LPTRGGKEIFIAINARGRAREGGIESQGEVKGGVVKNG